MPRKNQKTETREKAILPAKRHEVGGKAVILVDGMNLAHRAYWAYRKLKHKTLEKVIDVSIYYGMVAMLKTWLQRNNWQPEKLVIFWDGDLHPERLKSYPDYKKKRHDKRDKRKHSKFMKKVARVQRLFYFMGVAQAWDTQVEGDDMCYLLVKEYIAFNRIIIISGDRDFDQLVNHDVTVFDPGRDRITVPGLVGAHNYGLNVNQLVDLKCLLGDHSDNISGFRGIGESKAPAFLKKYGSIQKYLDDEDALYTGLTDKDKLAQVYKRNRKLMDLRFFNEKYHGKKEVNWYRGDKYPQFKEAKYQNFCMRFGLKTFLSKPLIEIIKSWQ